MTPLIAITFAATVLSTSFISGIFGMAGGMILLGVLLLIMPVTAAMVLHGITQMSSNGWRAWLWHRHIQWRVVLCFAAGASIAVVGFAAVALVPSKPVAFLMLGGIGLTGLLLPASLAPNVTRPMSGVVCGLICTTLQFLAGIAGPILDVFFVRSNLDRKQMVATKAATQVLGHFLKIAYFGTLMVEGEGHIDAVVILSAIALAFVGTQLSRHVLDAMSDTQFRRWTRAVIACVATVYLVRGLALLVDQTAAQAAVLLVP